MSTDDVRLLAEAEACDDCPGWLEHCEADCCNYLSFRLSPTSDVEYLSDSIRIRLAMTDELRKYLELHDVWVEDDVVVLGTERCEVSPERIWVPARCRALQDDLLCALHPAGKPDCCREFTYESAESGEYTVPERCLFAYKLRARAARAREDARL